MKYLSLAALLALSGCGASEPDNVYRPTSSIQEIMDSIVDPNADNIWESIAVVVDFEGVHENFPSTDDEWAAVRHSAISVIEGSNLLLMPGRPVAKPGTKSENPEIELEPAQIQELIDQDREAWVEHAHDLHDIAVQTLERIDAHDAEGLLAIGGHLDRACESCHLNYWYPNDEAARRVYEESAPAYEETAP